MLSSASAQATGLPLIVVTLVAGLGLGYVLFRSSRWLAGAPTGCSTRACCSPRAGLVSLAWLAIAYLGGRGDLLDAQQRGSAPAQAFARADIAALQAHADESLTLIDNGGDDAYQKDYLAQQKLLGPGTRHAARRGTGGGGSGGPAARRRGAGAGLVPGACGAACRGRRRESRRCRAVGAGRRGRRRVSRGCPRPSARGSTTTRPSSPPAPAVAGTRSPGLPWASSWRRW